MSITRRIFITVLAAVLPIIRISGVSALEATAKPEDDLDEYEEGPPIEYLEIGECEEMLGGPAREPGWYLHPVCMIGCCETEGPFPSERAALEADRIRWDKIAKDSRRRTEAEDETPEDLFF